MRMTLHVAAADDFPAYAQLCRQARMRTLRKRTRSSTRSACTRELGEWLPSRARTSRSASASATYDGAPPDPNMPLLYARTLLPLTFLPPAGHWRDTTRNARFVLDPRPLPDPEDAGALVLTRYLEAFGPAAKRDVAAWAGVAQRDFPWERVRDRLLPRRAGPRAARPARAARSRPRTRSSRRASSATGTSRCWPTPTATGSSRPRSSR